MNQTISNSLTTQLVIAGGGLAILGTFLIRKIVGGEVAATVLQYLIPVMLLVVLNIFIFPLSGLEKTVGFMDATGVSFTIFIFGFFNLFFVLAVLEFVRGNI